MVPDIVSFFQKLECRCNRDVRNWRIVFLPMSGIVIMCFHIMAAPAKMTEDGVEDEEKINWMDWDTYFFHFIDCWLGWLNDWWLMTWLSDRLMVCGIDKLIDSWCHRLINRLIFCLICSDLKREAKICLQLNHPHVVKLVDTFLEDGTYYVLYEL